MAYDKHTWTCDEPITVERLNHIEDGIANAGGDCGFECEEDVTLLTEETVTTASHGGMFSGDLSYSQFINAETVRVTFNGVEYDCPRIVLSSNQNLYGGYNPTTQRPDFSVYPFVISSHSGSDIGGRGNTRDVDPTSSGILTETAGTYTVKIEAVGEMTVTTTPCFDLARGYSCEEEIVTLTEESVTTTMEEGDTEAYGDLSYSQLIDADTIVVTFDGVEYECPRTDDGNYGAQWDGGAMDWSNYPFQINPTRNPFTDEVANEVVTETAGTYTIKIETEEEIITTTPCFDKARGYSCKEVVLTEETLTAILIRP